MAVYTVIFSISVMLLMAFIGWAVTGEDVDALLPQSGSVELIGRIKTVLRPTGVQGYHLQVSDTGAWSLFREAGDGLPPLSLPAGEQHFYLTGTLALQGQGA